MTLFSEARQPSLRPERFINKWMSVQFGEKQAAQEMFLDICRMVGHATPGDYGNPAAFTFEKWVPGGFADAYLEERFGWEFKGSDGDLDGAMTQLLRYQVHLKTPPLLIVSSFRSIRIQTNFPGMVTTRHDIALPELAEPEKLQLLRSAFFAPGDLRPERSVEEVTRETADLFRDIVADMEAHNEDPERLARYLNQIVFCLYAEDAGLLPDKLFTQIVSREYRDPASFNRAMGGLFERMAVGGMFGAAEIPWFNGDLFEAADTVELSPAALQRLGEAAKKNWNGIEPSIFGTLFERALDASKRSQLGAHYTGAEDIMLVVEPVVLEPLRREWETAKGEIGDYLADGDKEKARRRLEDYRSRLAGVKVLDPACGSGNFLYIALRSLLDLERQAIDFAAVQGWEGLTPLVKPNQMQGLEINSYAAELARTALWIGYIQWHQANGFEYVQEPILTPLDTVRQGDAILDLTDPDNPKEPEWPAADFVIGNPPFLGRRSWNKNFERSYIDDVDTAYKSALKRSSDLCCYWFELARQQIANGKAKRAGLLATQNIRSVYSRGVLERITESGGIFMAYPDRDWLLDGASVHVSIIGFDDGSQTSKTVDGEPVDHIFANLEPQVDLVAARKLPANAGIAFRGPSTSPFDIPGDVAAKFLAAVGNPNRKPNSDVVVPVRNGQDLSSRPRGYYTIAFGDRSLAEAAAYEAPFELAKQAAEQAGLDLTGNYWQSRQPARNMTAALAGLPRYIAHSVTAKHLTFVWVEAGTICNNATNVFARADDYFFGVLHSRIHNLWARAMGPQLRDKESASRYIPTACFWTFPFPEPTEGQRAAIAEAAVNLDELRGNWLEPAVEEGKVGLTEEERKGRTLTNLYNQSPSWLVNAHQELDAAVAAAYGWAADLAEQEVLGRLLGLNLERAG